MAHQIDEYDEMLEYELSERIIERALTDSDKLLEIVMEVFKRLPEKDADVLIEDRDVYFIQPFANIARPFIKHIPCTGKEDFVTATTWLIILRSDLVDESKEAFIYTVAHELAHCFLEHSIGEPQQEIDADNQLLEWGFEKEVKDPSSDSYLCGDGYHQRHVREECQVKNPLKGGDW